MTRRGQYPKGQHPYGTAYQRERSRILAGNPTCHWCDQPATTADHEPPIEVAGPHNRLVPACRKCNYGRHGKTPAPKRTYPGPSREW